MKNKSLPLTKNLGLSRYFDLLKVILGLGIEKIVQLIIHEDGLQIQQHKQQSLDALQNITLLLLLSHLPFFQSGNNKIDGNINNNNNFKENTNKTNKLTE